MGFIPLFNFEMNEAMEFYNHYIREPKMKSEWRVTSNWIGGVKLYSVYRLLDITEVDHSGNRQYIRKFLPEETAQQLADSLNTPAGPVVTIPQNKRELDATIDALRNMIAQDTDVMGLVYHQQALDALEAAADQKGR